MHNELLVARLVQKAEENGMKKVNGTDRFLCNVNSVYSKLKESAINEVYFAFETSCVFSRFLTCICFHKFYFILIFFNRIFKKTIAMKLYYSAEHTLKFCFYFSCRSLTWKKWAIRSYHSRLLMNSIRN